MKKLFRPSKVDFGLLESRPIWFAEGFYEAFPDNQHAQVEDDSRSKMEI